MGYRIWSKDKNVWELTFDTVYKTRELAEDQVAELNAVYKTRVSLGELEFLIYPEEIKIAKNGQIVDLPTKKSNEIYSFTYTQEYIKREFKLPNRKK